MKHFVENLPDEQQYGWSKEKKGDKITGTSHLQERCVDYLRYL